MMNPDGVILGNFRNDISGEDLNKVFDSCSKTVNPILSALIQNIQKEKRNFIKKPIFLFDLHTHCLRPNLFAKMNPSSLGEYEKYLSKIFLKICDKKIPGFRNLSSDEINAKAKKQSAIEFFQENFRYSYTFFLSSALYKLKYKFDKEPIPFDSINLVQQVK